MVGVHVAFLLAYAVVAVAVQSASASSSSSLAAAFTTLNATVAGKLRIAVPFERPCFSIYQGERVRTNQAACNAVQDNYTDPTFRVTHFGSYMLPQWETCQASKRTEGCLLDSSDPSNLQAFAGVDCRLGNIPPYYIEVNSVSDIQAALKFSKLTGVRLSVKNKGHDYKGRSSGKDTLALWTTGFKHLSHSSQFTPEGCHHGPTYDAITAGSSVFTQDVYEFADKVNRTVIAGYHQTVGFSGGYFLGGGHSILSPAYGLAVDRVVQVKVVTPDGVYRTANECQNQDLFFALRGGGGSAFGVVVESTHRTEPTVTLQAAIIKFTPTASDDLAQWYSLTVNNSYQWANEAWGGHIVGPTLIHVNPLLNNTEARKSMQPAIDFALARNGSVVIEELPSFLAFFNKYVTLAQAAVGPELSLGTRLLPSKLFSTQEGRDQLNALITATLPYASPYIVAGTPWLYKGKPGETSVTPAWRAAIWHISIKVQFSWNNTLEDRRQLYETHEEHIQQFRDLTPDSGSYFNEGAVYEPDYTQSYWGENYPKLLSVKKKYDPHGLLDCWQCVGWKGPSDPLYQCYIKL
ncbi:FAD-binding domain-containing protein [Trametes elegans]|nr:FAD-binding domain-containing protein [Trametes elegans]